MASPTITLAFAVCGVALGTLTGLLPGLHVNSVAFLLVGVAPSIDGPPGAVGAAILAAGVVHTFLSIVPGLVLGVPDAATAPGALPGHRLVLAGRGREAIRLSAVGSGVALVGAVAVALPLSRVVAAGREWLLAALPVLLALVAGFLILAEPTRRARLGGLLCLGVATALGFLTLDLHATGVLTPTGAASMLAPIFGGLFGAPILLEALSGEGVPPQADAVVTESRRVVGGVALLGTLSGAVVGFLPGISSAIAATGALVASPRRGPRAFVVATSGVNTSNAVFALFALVALGSPRTGVLVAMRDAGVPLDLPLLLASVAVAAAAGFVLVVVVGDRYLAWVGQRDNAAVSVAVLAFLVVLVALFTGLAGLAAFLGSTVVGLVPARFGARRATLMGVLLVPLALG